MCLSQDKLSKTVNMRAMNMLGKAEERVSLASSSTCMVSSSSSGLCGSCGVQYNDLLKKKDIVAIDKTKIVKLIEELDQKKNTTLREAHERVNKVCYHLAHCM